MDIGTVLRILDFCLIAPCCSLSLILSSAESVHVLATSPGAIRAVSLKAVRNSLGESVTLTSLAFSRPIVECLFMHESSLSIFFVLKGLNFWMVLAAVFGAR